MIIRKSFHVLDRATLKTGFAGGVLCVVFILILVFDLTGYESRIPDFESVSVSGTNAVTTQNFSDYDVKYFSEEKNVESILNLHGNIIEHKKEFKKMLYNLRNSSMSDTTYIEMSYYKTEEDRENKKPILSRKFRVPTDFMSTENNMKALYESGENKKLLMPSDIVKENVRSIEIVPRIAVLCEPANSGERIILDETSIKELIQAFEKDIEKSTYEDIRDRRAVYGYMEITYIEPATATESAHRNYLTLSILPTFKNTIAWINEKGYGPYMNQKADNLAYATIKKLTINDENSQATQQRAYEPTVEIPEPTSTLMVITDKKQLETILSNCQSRRMGTTYYEVTAYIRNSEFDEKEVGILDSEGLYIDCMNDFFSEDSLPDFAAEYFNGK